MRIGVDVGGTKIVLKRTSLVRGFLNLSQKLQAKH